jgi:hypothetical protein
MEEGQARLRLFEIELELVNRRLMARAPSSGTLVDLRRALMRALIDVLSRDTGEQPAALGAPNNQHHA